MVVKQAKTIYIADTNILIGFYLWKPISLKFNKPFWDELSNALVRGDWVLLDVVVNEIHGKSSLVSWCKEQKEKRLVTKIDDSIRERGVRINDMYPMINQDTFKSEVDTFIIAFAEKNQLGIFSRESKKTNKSVGGNNLYKIPDVCNLLNPKIKSTRSPVIFLMSIGFN